MSFSKSLAILLIAIIALSGCLKDSTLPTKIAPITISSGIPVINSKMTIGNAVQRTDTNFILSINSEGYYSFLFDPDKQKFPRADAFIVLKDIELFNKTGDLKPTIPIPGNASVPTKNFGPFVVTVAGYGDNQFKGAELKKIYYKSGIVVVNMSSTYQKLVKLNLVFTSLTKNNQPLKMYYELDGSQSTQSSVGNTQSIGGYNLDLTGDNDLSNSLKFNIEFTEAIPSSPTAGEIKVDLMIFGSQSWSRIDGKLGTIEIPITNDTVPVSATNSGASNSIALIPFANNDNADADAAAMEFKFENPRMFGKLYNGFGVPMALKIKPINAIGINGQILNTIESVTYPLNKLGQPGNTQIASLFTISGGPGTAFGNLFKKGPKEIQYGIYMVIDAANNFSNDFILDSSRISADINIDLPLYGTFSLFNLKSISENPLYQSTQTSTVSTSGITLEPQKAEIRFAYENTMPVGFSLQVFFLDADSNVLNQTGTSTPLTLFPSGNEVKAEPASVGADGNSNKTVNTYETPVKIVLTTDQFDQIKKQSKYIKFVARINSYDVLGSKPAVKIRPQDYITIRLSAALDGQIIFNNK